VPFYIDGDWIDASAGSAIHIPPGVEHAVDKPGSPARMLMIIQPSGFDQYLAELSDCTEADFADEAKMKELAEKYDIINLGDVPAR
ncbi:MAG: cupin domain-containing protein, partial [Planctomycetota bacterium]